MSLIDNWLKTFTRRSMRHGTFDEYFNTIVLLPETTGSTFIHEAGHALGANHDRYTSIQGWNTGGDGGLSSLDDREGYNYGYCLPGNKYATITSYPWNCPKNAASERIERILYFSSPDVSYEGVPTGDSLNNNARYIRENRDIRSRDGTNCYDGFPESDSPMGQKLCDWTPWTGFQAWEKCCCVDYEDSTDCPMVP